MSFFVDYAPRIKAVVCLGLAVVFGLALVSYSSYDPSFNRVAEGPVHNLLGSFGSYVADLMIQAVGWASLLVPLVFFFWAKSYYHNQEVRYLYLRIPSLIVSVLAMSVLLAHIEIPASWPLYIGFGGIVGDQIHFLTSHQAPVYEFAFIIGLAAITMGSLFFATTLSAADLVFAYQYINYYVQSAIYQLSCYWDAYRAKRRDQSEASDNREDEDDDEEDDDTESDEEEPEDEDDDESEEDVLDAEDEPVAAAPKKQKVIKKPKVELQKPKRAAPSKPIIAQQRKGDFILPSYDFLVKPDAAPKNTFSHAMLEQRAQLLKKVLADFGVEGNIIRVKPGPVVTLYELEPSPGTKSSRVIGLADDIARSMSAVSARISTIPGRNVLGIELPNKARETVYLRELLESEDYQDKRIKLPIVLGRDIGGESVMVDLSRMPHLLVAGTTGSGKSVAINAMILSFLYRLSPDECKFIMIDPKMLELSVYEGIPHLLAPVVTEPGKAIVALKWAVKEMEERYRAMSYLGVRNIAGYNKRIEEALERGDVLERQVQTGFDPETGQPIYETQQLDMKPLPFIVVIVDEMADLMLTAGKDIESSIQRLAQMARAAGIHMIMATQRPSVDVITGVIKANFPTRISFQVTSRIDSRTILGEMGAEQLLGMGDMLYMAGGNRITRVHGPYVDDNEVVQVVNHLKEQGMPTYVDDVTKDDGSMGGGAGLGESGDELYDQAVNIVLRDKKASTSYIQRQLKIGYNRAANIIEKMEQEGVVSPANHAGKREILVN